MIYWPSIWLTWCSMMTCSVDIVISITSGVVKSLNLQVAFTFQVIKDRKWKEIAKGFDFLETLTSASYVLKKWYSTLLHDYEQVYFFRSSEYSAIILSVHKKCHFSLCTFFSVSNSLCLSIHSCTNSARSACWEARSNQFHNPEEEACSNASHRYASLHTIGFLLSRVKFVW